MNRAQAVADAAGAKRSKTHRRDVGDEVHVWRVDRLIELAADLPTERRSLSEFDADLDEIYWFGGPDHRPTVRAVADHARRIAAVDLTFPIILSAEGVVVDGMHRVAKAYLEGRGHIEVVQFEEDPSPDEVLRPDG